MEENKQCPECKAYEGHSPTCSLITFEFAKEELKRYYQSWLDRERISNEKMQKYISWVRKANQRAELWEGKYRAVKTENNALRKKVAKQKREDKEYKQIKDLGVQVINPSIAPLNPDNFKTKEET